MKGKRNLIFFLVMVMTLPFLLGNSNGDGCDNRSAAMNDAQKQSQTRDYYLMKNDVEYKNYSKRQKLADDPTTVLWCTAFPPTVGQKPFTVPVVGKLTSGGKRPFESYVGTPGPDAMYGDSGEYRYGFTPADFYADYYGLSVFCTNEPMIWQKNNTDIIMRPDPELLKAHNEARKALQDGLTNTNQFTPQSVKKAYDILNKAVGE